MRSPRWVVVSAMSDALDTSGSMKELAFLRREWGDHRIRLQVLQDRLAEQDRIIERLSHMLRIYRERCPDTEINE